jgi:hypothetical protein
MNERAKITASHLARHAVVYLRQSSAAQVEHNRESTAQRKMLSSRVRLHRRFHALHRARPDLEFPRRPRYPDTRVSTARIAFSIFGSTFERPIALRDLVSHIRAWRKESRRPRSVARSRIRNQLSSQNADGRLRGTVGSNPSPSRSVSAANLGR